MKQKRPFQVVISESHKRALVADATKFGHHYGIFFSTSGRVITERINTTAQYDYIFRTDKP